MPDGIVVQKVSQLTYEATRQYVRTLVGVDEGLISETLIGPFTPKQGIVAEPAGAARYRLYRSFIFEYIMGKSICVSFLEEAMISTVLGAEMEERALIYDGIKHYFLWSILPQRPGCSA